MVTCLPLPLYLKLKGPAKDVLHIVNYSLSSNLNQRSIIQAVTVANLRVIQIEKCGINNPGFFEDLFNEIGKVEMFKKLIIRHEAVAFSYESVAKIL
jgi:predicted amidohydrolase